MPGEEKCRITGVSVNSWSNDEILKKESSNFSEIYAYFKDLPKLTINKDYEINNESNNIFLRDADTSRLVTICQKYRKCKHRKTDARLQATNISLGNVQGLLTDTLNNLWLIDLEPNNNQELSASFLYSFSKDSILKVVAGREHFLILVKKSGPLRRRLSSFCTITEQDENDKYDFCYDCKSKGVDSQRLSQLMLDADFKASSNTDPLTISEVENMKKGRQRTSSNMVNTSEYKNKMSEVFDPGDNFFDKQWDISDLKGFSSSGRTFSQSNPNELDFSFVSMNRISVWDKIELAKESFCDGSRNATQEVSIDHSRTWFEVWSLGGNDYGQLGLSDTVKRLTPCHLLGLYDSVVTDIVAGLNFSAALTASGEIYVWGTNISRNDCENILEPRLQKLGLDQFAFAIAASLNSLWILLNGKETSVVLYRIGEHNEKNITTRVKLVKNHIPIRLVASSEEVHLLKILSNERSKCLLHIHFNAGQTAKMIKGILDVLTKIKLSTVDKYIPMMTELCESLLHLQQEISVIMQFAIAVLQGSDSSKDIIDVLIKFSSTKYMNYMYSAINQCAVVIGSGYIHSITFTVDVKNVLDHLTAIYDQESTQPSKALVKLFYRIIHWLKYLETYGQELASNSQTESTRSLLSSSFQIWQRAMKFLKRQLEMADKTQLIWKDQTLANLNVTGRFLLGVYKVGVKDELKRVVVEKPKYRLMNPKISKVYIFSDLFVLVLNGEPRGYDLNLVWTEKTPEDVITIKSPDMECNIELNADHKNFDTNLNSFLLQTRYMFDRMMEGAPYPLSRRGKHQFSADCEREKLRLATYEGEWLKNRMHGKGVLTFQNGDIHKGLFVEDMLHGFGEIHRAVVEERDSTTGMLSSFYISTPVKPDKFNIFRGVFIKGVLNGIAQLRFADGRTYEGYVLNDEPHGFGVMRYANKIHVGAFQNGGENGYGVTSDAKQKCLGEFGASKEKTNRLIVNLDGAVVDGELQNDVLKNGHVIAVMPDGETVEYEGEMDGNLIGKNGQLHLSKSRTISGTFGGDILTGEIQILDGTLKFNNTREDIMSGEIPKLSQWSVPMEKRWKEMFDIFRAEELGIKDGNNIDCGHVWSSIVWSMERGRQLICRTAGDSDDKYSLRSGFCVALEHIPDYDAPWSAQYYEMVVEYWRLALDNIYHPLSRILISVVDVFQISYGDIAEHRALYANATLEASHLIHQIYSLVRILFPSLPEDPNHVISNDFTEEMVMSRKLSDDVFITVSSDDSPPTSSDSSPQKLKPNPSGENKFRFPIPACDFINDAFFSRCGPVLFSIFSLYNKEVNDRYWERTLYLNNFTDVKILRFLTVPRELWPIELDKEITNDLDNPLIVATARDKFYRNAVNILQRLPMETNPSQKLRIIADTFSAMKSSVDKLVESGSHVWSADDLLPAFTYVVIRSQIRHLGTEILLIDNFSRDFRGSGEISMMFTMLHSSYQLIVHEKNRI